MNPSPILSTETHLQSLLPLGLLPLGLLTPLGDEHLLAAAKRLLLLVEEGHALVTLLAQLHLATIQSLLTLVEELRVVLQRATNLGIG